MAKAGDKAPLLILRADSAALVAAARVMLMVYVSVVTPSWAVTTMVIVFDPVFNPIDPDAALLATAVPFTFTVAVASSKVGVTVTEVIELATFAV